MEVFSCCRGKYAKRLFPPHISRISSGFTLLNLQAAFVVQFRAFLGLLVKWESKIRLLASLADLPLLKN